jgi:imidazolonepropionase-like amidohydrolase
VREEIRKYLQAGIDFLTVGITAHSGSAQQYLIFSPRVLQVIIEEAHRAGLVVVGFHAQSSEAVDYALNAGVDLLIGSSTIGQPLPAETVAQITQRQFPCCIHPLSSEDMEWYRRQQHVNPDDYLKSFVISNVNGQRLIRAGAQVLLGTGGGVYSADFLTTSHRRAWVPPSDWMTILGEGYVYWLRAVQELGMKPMDALMAATRNIARAYKVDKDLGTLEPGKLADLVILDKDPLENAGHYRSISLVMKEGQIVGRDALPTRRLLTAQTPPRAQGTETPQAAPS